MESTLQKLFFIILAVCCTFNVSESRKGGTITVKTIDGDVYRCVDIYKQPSLKHPALKDLQVKEKLYKYLDDQIILAKQQSKIDSDHSTFSKGIWEKESCPIGTVPIRQTITKKSKLDRSSLKSPVFNGSLDQRTSDTDFAGIVTKSVPQTEVEQYTGAWATINLYNPQVEEEQYSSASIILESGDSTTSNLVQAGWIVNPSLYGDYKTRMFTHWKENQNGCFNTQCPGFVQTNNKIPLDFAYPDISKREGEQFDTTYIIKQVNDTWEFSTRDPPEIVGHWPAYLFTNMKQSAQQIRIGGQVYAPLKDDQTPPMGSGVFNNNQFHITCYVRNVNVGNRNGAKILPASYFTDVIQSRSCYLAGANGFFNDPFWNYRFVFGGKGGKEGYNCFLH